MDGHAFRYDSQRRKLAENHSDQRQFPARPVGPRLLTRRLRRPYRTGNRQLQRDHRRYHDRRHPECLGFTLSIVAGPILIPNPGTLVFTAQTGQGNPANQTSLFGGSDDTLNPLSITATTSTSWIKIVSSSSAFVIVGVDQTGLSTGSYTGSISVTQAGAANSPLTVPVVLVVNGGGGSGSGNLTFSPSSMSFSSVNGSTPSAQTLTVSATSTTTFVVNAHRLCR